MPFSQEKVVVAHITSAMTGWNALFSLGILIAFVCGIYYIISMSCFYAFMKSQPGEFTPVGGSIRQRVIQLFEARVTGRSWFAKRDHILIGAICVAIAVWGFVLASVSGRGADFSRSGALISILGLVAAFVGWVHSKSLFELRNVVDPKAANGNRAAINERAEGLSRVWVAIIIATGTMIWGYGDLMFDGLSAQMCPHGGKLTRFECVAPAKIAPPKKPKPPAPQRFLIFFNWNASSITPNSNIVLWQVAEITKKNPKTKIRVFAYADTAGSIKSNAEISVRRAKSVRTALVELGVNKKAIAIFPRGATDLMVPTGADVRELQNRRVEIWVGE